MHSCSSKRRCYHDKVDPDENNRVFYIYSLSKYHNRHYYHYGSTLDIMAKEVSLAKLYPFYKHVCHIPIGRMTQAEDAFHEYIKPLRTTCPLREMNDIFTLEDSDMLEQVLSKTNELFKVDIRFDNQM